jgi:hypothetical protein
MKAGEIRSELLEQHVVLRGLIEEACTATASWRRSASTRNEARDCFVRLLDALRRHNMREEELLRGVLPGIDAWGGVRVEIMNEEHVEEHREIYSALSTLVMSSEAAQSERTLVALRARLLDHMAHEEKMFLCDDVLHDDERPIDSFGG